MVVHILNVMGAVRGAWARGGARDAAVAAASFSRRNWLRFLLGVSLLGLAGCAPAPHRPAAQPPPFPTTGRGRERASAKVETGRLKEEDLGLERAPAQPQSDRILVPAELARSEPERAAALRLTEQARQLLLAGQDTERAVALLEQAVGLDSHSPYAYYFLGEAHFRLGSPDRALGFLERASSLLESNPYWASRVWGLRGLIWESGGQRDRALNAYRRALALWPENLTAVSGRARLGGGLPE